jgi:hypothetical protein
VEAFQFGMHHIWLALVSSEAFSVDHIVLSALYVVGSEFMMMYTVCVLTMGSV